MNEDSKSLSGDFKYVLNPHELYLRVYLEWDDETHVYKHGLYRLVEEDGWDEYHHIDILRNATLENIFLVSDLMGIPLVDRNRWEQNILDNTPRI